MMRGAHYDNNGIKRGVWSKEEDERLRAYVERHGPSNWRQLTKCAGLSRCGKSCRLRWLNYLRPGLKRGNYTQEEGKLIIKLYEQNGNKRRWSSIMRKNLEFKTKTSGTCEGETTKSFEPENPLLGFAASSSSYISEGSPPMI